MTDPRLGIEGVDLLELDIISKDRLPKVSADFTTAYAQNASFNESQFSRTAQVGNYPDGPSAEWAQLAKLLDQSLTESSRNLDDTSAAIQSILADIMRVDHGAKSRLDKARAEMNGQVPG